MQYFQQFLRFDSVQLADYNVPIKFSSKKNWIKSF